MKRTERGEAGQMALFALSGVIVLAFVTAFAMWGCPNYSVYEQRLAGEAELQRATFSRQIAVQEANAKKESAKALAEADVLRAEGAARANVILGNSLKGNEDYLRYLWIQSLENGKNGAQVIYVPTEAGLPILEAGKRQ